MSAQTITIRGSGIAACCCAFLLQKAGLRIRWLETHRPQLPAIMLSSTAVSLIRDIFDSPGLFADPDVHKIDSRVVAWGPNATPMVLDHSAIVISEQRLLESIRARFAIESAPEATVADWTIIASQPLPEGIDEHRFGARTGSVARVDLTEHAAPSCWIESLDAGWLFLIADGQRSGWLLAIGESIEWLLDQSSVIRERIASWSASTRGVPAYPRIAAPLWASRSLLCGTAAMAFDPICGDGTAHAIRQAILCAAVTRAVVGAGEDVQHVLAHYESRLWAAFRRHLMLCVDFYSRGQPTPWWQEECAALRRGIDWCDTKLSTTSGFRYRLVGFDIQAIP
jgi:2-polyprenyl-6-methoxyphenol hydroxylase-like FAD-dependent oxidoreductase